MDSGFAFDLEREAFVSFLAGVFLSVVFFTGEADLRTLFDLDGLTSFFAADLATDFEAVLFAGLLAGVLAGVLAAALATDLVGDLEGLRSLAADLTYGVFLDTSSLAAVSRVFLAEAAGFTADLATDFWTDFFSGEAAFLTDGDFLGWLGDRFADDFFGEGDFFGEADFLGDADFFGEGLLSFLGEDF